MQAEHLLTSLRKATRTFINILPIVIGMLLLTSLFMTLMEEKLTAELFSGHDLLDAVIGAGIGGIAVGPPLVSYLLGGEFLNNGVSLFAVTAFIVSWVTVGLVQLPAEVLLLGKRFALYRNLVCFVSAVAVAYLVVWTLQVLA
jgi:hypothetical protein